MTFFPQLIMILLPFTIIFSLTAIMYIKGLLKLNHQNLMKQPIFWWSITAPILLFFYFGYWSWKNSSPSLTSEGLETFYTLSKIPLLFLASSVPLAAMVNNIHRTIQTEKQINESKKKNQTDGYYNHLKFTLDQFKAIEGKEITNISFIKERYQIKIIRPMKLYNKIFFKSNPSEGMNFDITPNFISTLNTKWQFLSQRSLFLNNILNREKNPEKKDFDEIARSADEIYKTYIDLCEQFCLYDFEFSKSRMIKTNSKSFDVTWLDTRDINNGLTELHRIITRILDVISNHSSLENLNLDKLNISDPASRLSSIYMILGVSHAIQD